MSISVSILGASGYVGGELIRLLHTHPHTDIKDLTSQQHAGKPVTRVHPHLRGQLQQAFVSAEDVRECDLLLLALPHGRAAGNIDQYAQLAGKIIDLSADFRLPDPPTYRHWYQQEHASPRWLEKFCYGLPETRREAIRAADYVSGVGCNATASNLALLPLARAGLIHTAICDLKVGSSEGGNQHSAASHHPSRSGSYRSFAPVGHRHEAEVRQETGVPDVHLTVTAVEMVRGVLCTAHVFLTEPKSEKELWKIYRTHYATEPFVRIVNERQGIHRLPEPKLLAGTNYCDVGFKVDPAGQRAVIVTALDNLMKGAAGTAVQCLNLMHGWPESTGLEFMGLHPV